MLNKITDKEIEDFKDLLKELSFWAGEKFAIDYSYKVDEKRVETAGGILGGAVGSAGQFFRFAGKSGANMMQKMGNAPGGAPGGFALIAVAGALSSMAGSNIAEYIVVQNNRKTELDNLISYSEKIEKKLVSDEREEVKALIVAVKRQRNELSKKR
ncbi:Uncharacterised protein [Mycobacteroides abscessus subsp. bolletii]|nr:Uncharacterised protein [Mycobacteroides abscessus subsp. bolletii]